MELTQVLKQRRTHKNFNGQPIAREKLNQLVTLAMTAPNHKRNEPWKFIIIEHAQVKNFWQKLTQSFSGENGDRLREKAEGTGKKVSQLGALVYVTCQKDENPARELENYAACSCAIQNLMLAATNENLGSFWSTSALFMVPEVYPLLSLDPQKEFIVGAIWLGEPTEQPSAPHYHIADKIKYWSC